MMHLMAASISAAELLKVIASAATIITSVIALVVFVVSFYAPARRLMRTRVTRAKKPVRKWIHKHKSGCRIPFWRPTRTWIQVWKQTKFLTEPNPKSPLAELQSPPAEIHWLGQILGEHAIDGYGDRDLSDLAEAYDEFAGRMNLRYLLTGGQQPPIDRAAEVALRVAEILRERVGLSEVHGGSYESSHGRTGCCCGKGFEKVHQSANPPGAAYVLTYESRTADIASGKNEVPEASRYVCRQLVLNGRPSFFDLKVRWDMSEVERPDPNSGEAHPPGTELDAEAHEYQGLLPLVKSFKFGRDVDWGNFYLDFFVGSRWYLDHKKMILKPRTGSGGQSAAMIGSGIVTLAVLPLTRDGYFIVAPRTMHTSFCPGYWGPGVNGNLDMPRKKLDGDDLDRDKNPDLKKAMIREAKEELGLELTRDQLRPLGIARIDNANESGTWVLATQAFTGLTVKELALRAAEADAVKGAWEIDGQLAAIPLPRDEKEAKRLLRWVRYGEKVMPHLAIALENKISELLGKPLDQLPEVSDIRCRRKPRGEVASRGLPEGSKLFWPGQTVELPDATVR